MVNSLPVPGPSGMAFREIALIASIGIGIAIVFIVWAKYFRKTEEAPQHHWLAEDEEEEGDSDKKGHRKKKKRMRRDHRPRNPTLSETGGLPPLRDPGQPPPQ